MTGNKKIFKNLVLKDRGWVTFGDGTKKQVLGKGTICIPGLPINGVGFAVCRTGCSCARCAGPATSSKLGQVTAILFNLCEPTYINFKPYQRDQKGTYQAETAYGAESGGGTVGRSSYHDALVCHPLLNNFCTGSRLIECEQ